MKTFLAAFFLLVAPLLAVQLAWDASPGPDVAGYRLKWGFIQGGPYPHVNEAGLALSATVEEPWPMGTTVYFTAYAYNTLGLESLPSNEIAYTLPVPTPTPEPTPTATPTATPTPPTPNPTPAPPDRLRFLLDALVRWWIRLFQHG